MDRSRTGENTSYGKRGDDPSAPTTAATKEPVVVPPDAPPVRDLPRRVPVDRDILDTLVRRSPEIAVYGSLAIAAQESLGNYSQAALRLQHVASDPSQLEQQQIWQDLKALLRPPLGRTRDVYAARDLLEDDVREAVLAFDDALDEAQAAIGGVLRLGHRERTDDAVATLRRAVDAMGPAIEKVTMGSRLLFDLSIDKLKESAQGARMALNALDPAPPSVDRTGSIGGYQSRDAELAARGDAGDDEAHAAGFNRTAKTAPHRVRDVDQRYVYEI